MSELKIKALNRSELDSFMKLLGEIECGDHYSEFNTVHIEWLKQKIEAHLSNGTKYYGCRSDQGEVLGIVGLQIESKIFTNGTAEIVDIGIVAEHRRSGLGSKLLNYAVELLKPSGIPTVFARTYAADTDTITFYGRNGFYPVAVIPETNGLEDEGTIVMRKRVQA